MVAPRKFQFTFRNAYVRRKDRFVVVTSDDIADKKGHHVASILVWDGSDWISQASCVSNASDFAMLDNPRLPMLLGKEGIISIWQANGGFNQVPVDSSDAGPQHYGDLQEIRIIDGCAYVVGTARTVYKKDGDNPWQAIDQSIRSEDDEEDAGFFSIDGFSSNELYAVGLEGEVATYDGRQWRLVDSPTNLILYRVVCAGNGKAYACGQSGVLLEGRHNEWRFIDHGVTDDTIWSAVWFKDCLYLSTSAGIFRLENDTLVPVDINAGRKKKIRIVEGSSFYRLAANHEIICSVGSKMVVWSEDAVNWQEVSYK